MEIKLRPITIYDIVPLFELRNDPKVVLASTQQKEITEKEHIDWVCQQMEWYRHGMLLEWVIYVGENFAGRIGITSGSPPFLHIAVCHQYRRRGIAEEAIRDFLVKRYGKNNALVAKIRNTNHAAKALFKKLGFGHSINEEDFLYLTKDLTKDLL